MEKHFLQLFTGAVSVWIFVNQRPQSLGLAVQGARPTEERICHRLAAVHLVFPTLCWAAASLLGAPEGLFSRSFCVLEKAV